MGAKHIPSASCRAPAARKKPVDQREKCSTFLAMSYRPRLHPCEGKEADGSALAPSLLPP